MITLQNVLDKLDEMDVSPSEIEISRAARNYIIGKGKEILDAEEKEEEE